MHAGELRVVEHDVRHFRGIARHEVDHAGRQAGGLEQLHDVVRAQHRARCRLPHDRAAHQRRGGRQVAADRREVERRDRVHEPFEPAIVGLIPHAVSADRLLSIQLLGECDVEAPEVNQLGRRIDLGLKHRLRLTEHRRRIQRLPPGRRQQFGGAEKHGSAVLPRPVRPVASGAERRLNGLSDFLRPAL